MGACCNRGFEEAYKTELFQAWMLQFNAMQLSKREIRKLYYIFKKVDVDGSGSIGLAELLTHIDLERTRFTERIFSIFDEDGSGEIDFREFVLSLWNYCTLTKATLDMFAFDLYDKDSSGELSAYEVTKMLQDIYGKKEAKNNFLAKTVAADLKVIEQSGDLLNIEAFRQFVKTHQALLFPAFQMQLALQRRILGQRFWARNANKRLKFSNGKYISIGNFILFNVDAKKKTLLASDAPEAVAMHGSNHMDEDVGKLMEVAGTKAARRNTVMLNERRGSFMGNSPAMTEQQLFSIKSKALFDTNAPMNESSKKEWLSSIMTMPTLFSKSRTSPTSFGASSGSSKSAKKTSAKNAKQINVSQKVAPAPPVTSSPGAFASNPDGSSRDMPRKNSKENVPNVTEVYASGTGSTRDKPRRNSVGNETIPLLNLNGSAVGIAALIDRDKPEPHAQNAHNSSHNNVHNSMHPKDINKDTSKHKKKDEIPSGRIKNPSLTLNAIKSIDAASPIEAWSSQPVESRKLNITASTKESSKDYSGKSGIMSDKTQPMNSGKGGAVVNNTNNGNGSSKPVRPKHTTNVELFEVDSVEDDKNDFSSSKKGARRGSLSKYEHHGNSSAAHNSTFADSTYHIPPGEPSAGTAAGDAGIGALKTGASKRGGW